MIKSRLPKILIIVAILLISIIMMRLIINVNANENVKENVKRKFLEYVYLTDEEYNKLISTYWEKVIKSYIEKLNNRIWENPNEKKRKKKSHYHTLCKRINDAWIPKIPPKPPENETWIYDLPF